MKTLTVNFVSAFRRDLAAMILIATPLVVLAQQGPGPGPRGPGSG
jgi:hypothetical protein